MTANARQYILTKELTAQEFFALSKEAQELLEGIELTYAITDGGASLAVDHEILHEVASGMVFDSILMVIVDELDNSLSDRIWFDYHKTKKLSVEDWSNLLKAIKLYIERGHTSEDFFFMP